MTVYSFIYLLAYLFISGILVDDAVSKCVHEMNNKTIKLCLLLDRLFTENYKATHSN